MRKLVVVFAALGAFAIVPSAQAAIPSVFGGAIACSVAADGVRECGSSSPRSTVPTFDGVPIDVNVAFPPDPGGGDGNYPLIGMFHGYAGGKIGFGASGTAEGMRRFTSRGFAVFSMTDRGFRESCGSAAARTAGGSACDAGFVRLLDTRYEVRDFQEFAGMLADEELIEPQRIGAQGGSYGGGLSLALAALKDRKMMPDGSLTKWVSPVDGKAMQIAAAVPSVPWTDLAYALVPNGRTLDFVKDAPYVGRFGVMKESFVNGLYTSGQLAPGYYAPVGTPGADLTGWLNRLSAGEPYDGDPTAAAILEEVTTNHSSYYIDHSQAPAPMLMSSGFTDDLVPADETIRFYNRTRTEFPSTPLKLFFGDFGHQRSANKPDAGSLLVTRENEWLEHYVKGSGPAPAQGVEAMTLTCPAAAASGGPFAAPNWADIAKGEVRFFSAEAKTISPSAGGGPSAAAFNPVFSPGACATAPGADEPGAANYRLPAAPPSGYTLMGSPTVIADIDSRTPGSQLAARLLDVDPATGEEVLVDRALFRPEVGSSRQIFQLHPNGWRFAAGHVPKLELLPRDGAGGVPFTNYARPSTVPPGTVPLSGQGPITVSKLDLRLPVLDAPGGAVQKRAPLILPCGYEAARDFAGLKHFKATLSGKPKVKSSSAKVTVQSAPGPNPCRVEVQLVKKADKKAAGKSATKTAKKVVLATATRTIGGGATAKLSLQLTKRGRAALARKHRPKLQVLVITKESDRTVQTVGLGKKGESKRKK